MNRLTLSEQTQHPTKRHTVVCVTNQFHCERLIRAGRLIADLSKTSLLVINVSSPNLSENDAKALEYLFQVSKENGAEMTVLYSDEPMRQLAKFIKENKAVNVVTGVAAQQNSPLPSLWRKFTSAHFFYCDRGRLLLGTRVHPAVPYRVKPWRQVSQPAAFSLLAMIVFWKGARPRCMMKNGHFLFPAPTGSILSGPLPGTPPSSRAGRLSRYPMA